MVHILDIVTDIRYKAGMDRIRAAYKILLQGTSIFIHQDGFLKGTVSRDFFHHTTSSGLSRHAQKRFEIFSHFRGFIRIRNRLPGDEYTRNRLESPTVG